MAPAVRVRSLRRYPVKCMGGEALDAVDLDARGLVGDRWYAVRDGAGRFASGKSTRRFRRRDEVFDFAATTGPDGVRVAGPGGRWAVDDPALAARLSGMVGEPVELAPEGEVPHQDGGQVSLVGTATLDWCARRWQLDADPRRLRVNVLLTTTEPFVEEGWVGREIAVGSARLRVVERVPRCRTVDVPADGSSARGRWLRPLTAERDGRLAVYADVLTPGRIAVGDVLTLL